MAEPVIEPVVSVEMGNAGDALDYALDHLETMLDKTDFLEAWREGDLRDYPGYLTWVAFQHRCAAESKAARPSQPPVTDVERAFRLEWVAAPRPPAHPAEMTGRQSFATVEGAIAFMGQQAPDARFVALTEIVTTKNDITADAIAAMQSK